MNRLSAQSVSTRRPGSRRLLMILLPALLLALLWQGITVQPAAAQGTLICGAPVPVLAVVNNSYSAEPVLTSNGSRAIFWSTANPSAATSNVDGNIEVFAVDLNLTQPSLNPQFRQLTQSSGSILGGFNLAPSVDSAGRFVAFFSDRDLVSGRNSDANFEIFRLDTSNNQIIQVTNSVRGSNLFPSISADGRLIAFVSDIAYVTGGSSGTDETRNLEIYIADLSNPVAITFDQVTTTTLGLHNNEDPVLSGDGSTLAFVSDFDGNPEIYLYDVGSNAQPVKISNTTSGISAHPSLSFDGSRLVFLSDQPLESGKTTGGNPQVFMFPHPQTGNGFFQVTQAGSYGHPVIDGAGNRLSYQRITGSQEDILLYDVANQAERQISVSAAGRTRVNPTISRDGTVIAYEDTGAIFVVNCPIADLSLVADPVPTAIAGTSATYRWSVTNSGTSSAAGVTVRGLFPVGFALNSAGAGASPECSQNGQQITCSLPLLTINETRTLTLPVNLAPDLLGAASIEIEAFSQNVTDPAPGNNARLLTTVVDAEADLRLTQPVTTVIAPLIDEPITYTLQLVNAGPSVARTVRITNTLPAELTFVSAPGCSANGNIVTCDVAAVMTPNSVLTRTVVALVSSLAETSVVNAAVAGSSTRDPQLANNSSLRTDRINTTFDLAVSQAVAPSVLRSGAPITYTFAVSNLGPSLASAVELSVTLPAQFVPTLGNNGRPLFCATFACAPGINTSQPFTIGLGAFTRQSVTVTIPGRVNAAFSGQITSSASVYSADDPLADRNLANNDTTATNDVFQEADLTVESINLLGEVVAGAPVTYVISALNNGPSVASNTVLTFSIEPGVSLTNLAVNQGQCSGSSLVTCVLDVFSPTQRLVVTATGTVDAALTGVVTTTASIRSDIIDLTPVFDDRTRADAVITRAELTLRNQPSSPQAVSGQDNLLFDLVVTNLGPSLARTVVLTNVLPISTTANQIFTPNGVSCGPLARTIVCDLGDLSAGAPVTITVRAGVNADAVGTLVNSASVASNITPLLSVNSVPVTTIQRADLRVVKTAAVGDGNANQLIDVGERVTYTVVVSNTGPSNATGIVISDRVPAILGAVLALPSQGNFTNDLWSVGALAAGRQTTLTVSALLGNATSGQTITNTALIQASDQPDPITNNNRSTVTFDVSLATDLAVAMTVSNATPQVLDTITYRITVTNNGPEDAAGVSVLDVLPFGLTYLSHSPGGASYDSATGIWEIGALNVGQTQTLSITVRVVGSGNIVNSATVDGTLIDPNPANDTASAPILVGLAADLRLSQNFSDDTPNVDDDLVIVLTLSNDGPDTATDVVVSYPIPALLTNAAVSTQGSDVYTSTSGLWSVPTLASGASTTLTVRRTLDRSGSFSSVGEVLSSSLFDPDSAPGNGTGNGEDDQTRVSVTVPQAADIAVTKSANAGPFKEGDTVSYTILARNNGPDTATNVVVTETLPITLLNVLLPTVSIAGDDGGDSSFVYYDIAQPGIVTGTLVWNVGTLTNGDTETLFLSLTVQPNTAGRTIADGTDGLQADQYDWNLANNLSQVIPVVIDGADLAVTKVVSDERPDVEETLVYTLTVTNNGPTDTTNVVVTDTLPAGLTYVDSSSAPTGSYNNLTGLWTIPALANQQTVTLLITTTVNAGLINQVITNTITSATSDVADGDRSNNTASAVIRVQQADLRVSIQTPNPTPAEGQITTFFIVVENTGPDIATSVVLTHALPISLTNRGGAPTQGSYTLATNRWDVGTLAVGTSARLSFFAEPIVGSGGQAITLTIAGLTLEQEDPTAAITATGTITVIGSDLRIPQIVISDDTPATGNQIGYTATVENLGPSANSNVILTQTVPAGTTFTVAESGATVTGNNVAWRLSLAPGASATRTMTVTVNAAAGTNLVATAVAASGLITTPDRFLFNNTRSFTVTVNQPAQITLATLPTVNEGSLFNVNGIFTDTDSPSIASAQVNYGDGSPALPLTLTQTPSGEGVTGSFALSNRYVDNGNYTVVITMTDSDNNSSVFSQLVTIQNVAPTVTSGGNVTGFVEGSSRTVNNMVTFSDPGYSALSTTETFTYSINWGDGSAPVTGAVTGVVNGSAGVATTGALSAAHTYADSGVYTVNVTITDDDGGSDSDSFTITVNNVAPTVIATTNRTVAEAALLSITDIVTFTDPAWTDAALGASETFTYSINWGDGSAPSTGNATIDANGSLGVLTRGSLNGSHVYADDDGSPYTVTVTVRDDDGGSTQASFQVTVTNVNPTITAVTANKAITEGVPLTIANIVTFTDPGFTALATSETFTYSIDLGDGSPLVTGSIVNTVTNGSAGTPTVGTFNITLTWGNDDDGRPYTTTVTIFDDNGGSASGSFRVAVANTNPTVALTGPAIVNEDPVVVHTYNFTVTDTGIGSEVYSIVGSPSCGSGTLTGTPVINSVNGIGNFQCIFPDGPSGTFVNIRVSDGAANDVTTALVTVNNLNPVVDNETATTDEATSVAVDVLNGDSDVPADTVTIGSAGTPTAGIVTVAGNALSLTYNPNGALENLGVGQSQQVTFTYNAVDEDGGSATGLVTVTVNGLNDAPIVGGTVTTAGLNDNAGATAIFANVTVNDVDGNDSLSLEIQLSNAAAGAVSGGGFNDQGGGLYRATGLTVAAANTALDNARFTPANNTGPSGTFNTTFTVTATDSQTAADDITSAALTITRLNDAPDLTGAVNTAGLNDNAGATAIFGAVTVADADNGDTLILDIQLSNAAAGSISGGGFVAQGGGLYRVTGLSVSAANTAFDNVTFTPANNTGPSGTFNTTFTVTATDSQTATDPFPSAALTITRVNDAPTLTTVNTLTGATEDTPFTITYADLAAAANEADAEGDTISFRVQTISSGTLTKGGVAVTPGTTLLSTGESWVWTPAADANGTLNAFTIVATDGTDASTPAVQVQVQVTGTDDAPTLTTVNTLTGATEDTPFTITYADLAAAANEADVDGDTLSFRVVAVSSGTLTKGGVAVTPGTTLLSTGEEWVWTPAADASGTLNAFTIVAWDGTAASSPAVQVQVQVTADNDAPTLTTVNTLIGATEDTPFTITYADLAAAANEADVEGSTLSFRVEAVSSGTLTKGGVAVTPGTTLLSTGESWVWTPAGDANGTLNAFTIVAWDGTAASTPAVQVQVQVTADNDAPTLTTVNTLTGATEDTPFTITYADLAAAANEADVDGDTLSFRVAAVSSGTLTKGGVAVTPGTTLLSTGEEWVWTPVGDANGTLNAFTIVATDGTAASSSAVQVQVQVTADNDAPTLTTVNTLNGATEDTPFTITYADLAAAANEADIDGDTLSFRVAAVSSGTLTKGGVAVTPGTTLLSTGEEWVWTPAADANGTLNAFTIVAWDGTAASSSAVQVQVQVAADNDAPTLTTANTLNGATEDTPFTITYADLAAAANEADVDGDTLSFRVEAVSSGTLTEGGVAVTPGTNLLSTGESWVWTPAADANGTLTAFTIVAWDGTAASSPAVQVQVQVTDTDDAPTLTTVNTLTGATEDTPFTITYADLAAAANEADPDGNTLSFRVEAVSSGTLTKGGVAVTPSTTLLSTGDEWVWTPVGDANGTLNAFTIVAWDGTAASSSAVQVQVQVTADNDAPTLTTNATLAIAAGTTDNTISDALLLVNDVDNSPDQLFFTVISPPNRGTLKLNGANLTLGDNFTQADVTANRLTYDHTAANSQDDDFTFSVSDGATGTIGSTVFTIQVDGVGNSSVPNLWDLVPRLYLPLLWANNISAQSELTGE